MNLVGGVSQTHSKRNDARGRIAAFGILNATSAIRNLIRENKTYQIGSIIQTGNKQKMNTLDQSLATLVERGLVSMEDARSRAKDAREFGRLFSLNAQGKAAHASDAPHASQNPNDAPLAPPPGTGEAPPMQPGQGVRGQPNRPGFKRD